MALSQLSEVRSYERVFVLEVIDGKKPLTSAGMPDPRLFKDGEDGNKLRIVMDPATCLWKFKYDKGAVPGGLAGEFTGVNRAVKHAEDYFSRRNVRIKDVIKED